MAAEQDRSRSWIVAEAVRQYAVASAATAHPPSQLSQGGLGASRLAQLIQDLALTPEARAIAADETLQLTEFLSPARPSTSVAFERYEEFLDWKQRRYVPR